MRPVIEGKARSFEVQREISHAYNDALQRRIGNTTWVSCQSYYRTGNGKVIATFPGPVILFWYLTRKVNWSDYMAVDADEWKRELKVGTITKRIVLGTAAVLLAFSWKGGRLGNALNEVVSITRHTMGVRR